MTLASVARLFACAQTGWRHVSMPAVLVSMMLVLTGCELLGVGLYPVQADIPEDHPIAMTVKENGYERPGLEAALETTFTEMFPVGSKIDDVRTRLVKIGIPCEPIGRETLVCIYYFRWYAEAGPLRGRIDQGGQVVLFVLETNDGILNAVRVSERAIGDNLRRQALPVVRDKSR